MEIKHFIDILSTREASDFYEKHGKNVFLDDKLLNTLLKEPWSEKTWDKFVRLACIIGCELSDQQSGEKKIFDILPVYKHFFYYIYDTISIDFDRDQVPYKYWHDIAQEEVDVLKTLIQKKKLKNFKRTKIYRILFKKCGERVNELEEKGLYHASNFAAPLPNYKPPKY